MIGILIFNGLAIAFVAAVAAGFVPAARLSGLLDWLHAIIGITPPPPHQTCTFALVWIVSSIVLVDGLLFLFFFLTVHLM